MIIILIEKLKGRESMKPIYLDNASTSFPKAPGLGDAVAKFLNNSAYNVGRGAYKKAIENSEMVIDARIKVADFFGAKSPKNIIFTGSVTHSLNMVLKGFLKSGDEVITSDMEHNAVMRPLTQIGTVIKHAASAENIKDLVTPASKAIVVNHASNVSGDIFDLETARKISLEHSIPLILDSAQSAGKIETDFSKGGIAAICFTGHKGLLAAQGIGGFVIDSEFAKSLDLNITGGTGSRSDSFDHPLLMPDKFEAGTPNLPGIVSLSHSLDYISNIGTETIAAKEAQMLEAFETLLSPHTKSGEIRFFAKGSRENRLAVSSLCAVNTDSAVFAHRLETEFGIMVRTGLHCAGLAHRSLGSYPEGSVRFSFSHQNSMQDIEFAADAISKILKSGQ